MLRGQLETEKLIDPQLSTLRGAKIQFSTKNQGLIKAESELTLREKLFRLFESRICLLLLHTHKLYSLANLFYYFMPFKYFFVIFFAPLCSLSLALAFSSSWQNNIYSLNFYCFIHSYKFHSIVSSESLSFRSCTRFFASVFTPHTHTQHSRNI